MAQTSLEFIKSRTTPENVVEVSRLVRQAMEKRLEEKILELIDKQDGDVTEIGEMIEIAEQQEKI